MSILPNIFNQNRSGGASGITFGFPKNGAGFTLLELMIAISIMVILATLVTVNFGTLHVDRNLRIAQNELITNLRKAQSYTLSSRIVQAGQSGQFFILKFDSQNPSQYTLQAMYNIFATPTPPTLVPNIETFRLPQGVVVSSTPVTIYRTNPYVPLTQTGNCALIAFKAPFAKVYFNGKITGNSNSGCTQSDLNNDDYGNLLNYVTNIPNQPTTTDSYAVITLTDISGTKIKKVLIRGISGLVCPTQDSVNCSTQ